MLLNRSPSWRQRSWLQLVNAVQDFGEQPSGDSDLCELECDGAAVAHDLGTDLDEFLTQRGERPVLCFLRYGRLLLWVISRPFSTAVRMSAFGGKADVNHCVGECPLVATGGSSYPDKTFVGRIERGFDFLGYHFGPDGLSVAQKTVEQFVERAIRLYEQEPREALASARLGSYVQRWVRWAGAGLIYAMPWGAVEIIGDTGTAS